MDMILQFSSSLHSMQSHFELHLEKSRRVSPQCSVAKPQPKLFGAIIMQTNPPLFYGYTTAISAIKFFAITCIDVDRDLTTAEGLGKCEQLSAKGRKGAVHDGHFFGFCQVFNLPNFADIIKGNLLKVIYSYFFHLVLNELLLYKPSNCF